jgi:carbonic anhydrase/acetyltransferase-like protein (isoleucine patch superfamily)
MKMSTIDIGDGVTIGTRGVVLYDTDLEDGVRMAPLSLVMKGETLRANTVWHGLPAQAARRASHGLAADVTTKEVTH